MAPPPISFSALPPTISSGGSAVLFWNAGAATPCNASGSWVGTRASSGAEPVGPLTSTTTFSLTCGAPGSETSAAATVTVAPPPSPPPTLSFFAASATVPFGGMAALTWSAPGATFCLGAGGPPLDPSGGVAGWGGFMNNGSTQRSGPLTSATDFLLTCYGPGGSVAGAVHVAVAPPAGPPPAITLAASPDHLQAGGSTVLTWTTSGTTSCGSSGGWLGSRPLGGTVKAGPLVATTPFTLACTGPGGASAASAMVTVPPQPGRWTPGGAAAEPRAFHTATRLLDGRVLVAGGTAAGRVLSSAELYDPATSTWSAASAMGTPRVYHTASLLPDGRVLVVGGDTGQFATATVELYDPRAGSWTPASAMATVRETHTATSLLDGRILVAGGDGGFGLGLDSAELYDPATGGWRAASAMATSHTGHTATLLADGQVLVAGGFFTTSYVPGGERYDPVRDAWRDAGLVDPPRYLHTASRLPDGQVLIVGGESGGDLFSAETWDPASQRWSFAGNLAFSRYGHTHTPLPGGSELVAGGRWLDGLASAERLDLGTGAWVWAPDMALGRWGHTATLLLDGSVLVAGGVARVEAERYWP